MQISSDLNETSGLLLLKPCFRTADHRAATVQAFARAFPEFLDIAALVKIMVW